MAIASWIPLFLPLLSKSCREIFASPVVTGHLREREPNASVYKQAVRAGMEFASGRHLAQEPSGGIMMVRITAFCDVGGFNERAIAGEEPDLAVRLSVALDTQMKKISAPMATQRCVQIFRFSQWWRRAVRGGHALAHQYVTNGHLPAGNVDLRDAKRAVLGPRSSASNTTASYGRPTGYRFF